MIGTLIRYIIIAIVLGIIGDVISHLSSKSKTIDKNVSTTHYRVKAPAVLKYACIEDSRRSFRSMRIYPMRQDP